MSHSVATLKQSLNKLLEINLEKVSIQRISEELGESAAIILAIILITPMCLPFANIPGLAQVVSLAMGIIFYRLLIGRETLWLPKKANDSSLDKKNLDKICNFLLKFIGKSDKYLKPRILSLTSQGFQKFLYIYCMFMIFVLALPLVIPFTNFMPAIAVLFINFGIFYRDGILVLIGLITGVISVIFITYVMIFGFELIKQFM